MLSCIRRERREGHGLAYMNHRYPIFLLSLGRKGAASDWGAGGEGETRLAESLLLQTVYHVMAIFTFR